MKLLVSVRNEVEAAKALSGGCDILDIKEPDRGSLGRSAPEIMEKIVQLTSNRVPVSAALGEFTDLFSHECIPSPRSGLSYIKAGTAGLRNVPNWQSKLRSMNLGSRWVAVIYADHADLAAPDPRELYDLACELGSAGILIDTCNKHGGRLVDRMTQNELFKWRERTREAGLFLALAGSLRLEDLISVAEVSPDIVAVRGAVCHYGNRTGEVGESLVRLWKERLTTCSSQTPTGLVAR
ncbi:MAG: (5-formylfuran-3-yl)methyl phosphate synthase [Planctomycetaceae bacterium]|nr:(5-formylfuran-3-yl)methyl phosphate synthase [Planctomycetaceae bacterium]